MSPVWLRGGKCNLDYHPVMDVMRSTPSLLLSFSIALHHVTIGQPSQESPLGPLTGDDGFGWDPDTLTPLWNTQFQRSEDVTLTPNLTLTLTLTLRTRVCAALQSCALGSTP